MHGKLAQTLWGLIPLKIKSLTAGTPKGVPESMLSEGFYGICSAQGLARW